MAIENQHKVTEELRGGLEKAFAGQGLPQFDRSRLAGLQQLPENQREDIIVAGSSVREETTEVGWTGKVPTRLVVPLGLGLASSMLDSRIPERHETRVIADPPPASASPRSSAG